LAVIAPEDRIYLS